MARRIIDISVSLQGGIMSDPPMMLPEVEYVTLRDSAAQVASLFHGLTAEDLPDGEDRAVENVRISTHNGTHLDAPWHYHSTMDGGRRAITIDEMPLDWCFGPGVKLDFRNRPDRQFDVEAPDKAWVTDITYIRTHEGFAYLAVVLDLFSRRVVGWAMQGRQTTNVVLQALLAAVWRRKPKNRVLVHSDQGSQFTSMEWASFLKHHNLEPSMSRRGNCHDNAVAESFFNLLKRERIRRKVYRTRAEARQDVFDYIEMFYNPTRKHARNGMLSPVEFERQHKAQSEGV